MANKIKYGLSNVYYAKATFDTDGSATYATPVAIKGAVSISLDAEGDSSEFYADDIIYESFNVNAGYSGDIEFALIPDSFRLAILNDIKDAKGVIVEDADATTEHFALLFEFKGDAKKIRHVLYNCTATRPSIESETKEDTVEPSTETLSLTAATVYNESLDKNIVKAKTSDDTDSTSYNGWFSAVYQPTAES